MPNEPRRELDSAARLTLITLGAAALRAERSDGAPDGVVTVFEIGKPVALLTYLACAPDRAVPRGHLLDLLWGDVEPDGAKHALRQTLWYLKKRLGQRPLVTGGDLLRLDAGVRCDRDAFLDAAERGDADAVVHLFTGDFFPGFAAPGGLEFERWADAERQRLRSIFWQNAEVLVRRWLSAARTRDAQTLARRVRDLDPLREAGWRLLFETIIAARDPIAATVEAGAFERLFAAEGIEPERATQALVRMMRQTKPNDDRPAEGGGLSAELVGRETEFASIVASWEGARQGRAGHIHVVAPAGLGKTRLLTDVHARLRASRARVVFVRGTVGTREISLSLAAELALVLGSLPGATGISPGSARALVSLNPATSSSFPSVASPTRDEPNDALRRSASALRELITVLADEQPLALFVDDLQWADDASRHLLVGIAGTLHNARALIVTASRPMVDVVHASESTRTIQLAPLSKVAVGALLASIAALPAERWADDLATELWHATAGSPLLILETLQLMVEQRLLDRVNGEWRAPNAHALLSALQAGGALRHRVERLDRMDRWLLTLLAVAGAPLAVDVIASALERTEDETTSMLGALEQRGIVARYGSLWASSHDELSAMAIELASDSAARTAARSLGRALIARRGADVRALQQSGVLLDRAGDGEGLTHAFSLFARVLRDAGDRRPNVTLAREFVTDRPAVTTRALARSLPIMHRLGLYSTRRQVTAAATIALVPLALAFVRGTARTVVPPPEAVLVVGSIGDDSVARLFEVPIRSAELPVGQVLRPDGRRRPDWTFRADREYPGVAQRPDGGSWLFERGMPDSGGIDVWEATRRGEQRLTSTHGDDQGPTWSPDGQWISFQTARWDPKSHYDIAVRDMRTGATRQLTSTLDSDMGPVWSPDGSRIAFRRGHWDGRKDATCIIDFDGRNERCFGSPNQDVSPLRAWTDAGHVLVGVVGSATTAIGVLSTVTGAIDTVTFSGGGPAIPSPDGRWIVCECARHGFGRHAQILFPVDAPNRAVELDLSRLTPGRIVIGWAARTVRPRAADRLVIESGLGAPAVMVPHLLTAVGVTAQGDTVTVGSVRWRSSDTTTAIIDSAGQLVGRHAGDVDVEVSAGGWRSAQRRLTIEPSREVELLRETWSDGIRTPWRAFGDPKPSVVASPGGTLGMSNNGDGSHSSGLYTETQYRTGRGLALDSRLSARITDLQWQLLTVAIDADIDSVMLRRWDHQHGALSRVPVIRQRVCRVDFPGGREGAGWGDSLHVVGGPEVRSIPVPRSFATGAWFDVRIQLLADGRCGFAVNGVPIWTSSNPVIPTSRVRVVLLGNSSGTTMLAGETTLREGVPADVDWGRASLTNAIDPSASVAKRRR